MRDTPVVAAQDGVLYGPFADEDGGNSVRIVDDCGWTHVYAHLEEVDPDVEYRAGSYIAAGTRLGSVGSSGRVYPAGRPRLTYSVYEDAPERSVDPWTYLFAVENTACLSGSACSCIEGTNVDGFSIPVTDTACGAQVCGQDNAVYECQGRRYWTQVSGPGTCLSGYTCTGGVFQDGRPIPEHMTHHKFKACGLSNTFWKCTQNGWKDTSEPC